MNVFVEDEDDVPLFTLRNTLRFAEWPQALLVSMWMHDTSQSNKYVKMEFIRAPQIVTDWYPDGIAVLTDPATFTFVRSRRVQYKYEMYDHAASGTKRLRITELSVYALDELPSGAEPPIDLSREEFLERFLAQRRKNV